MCALGTASERISRLESGCLKRCVIQVQRWMGGGVLGWARGGLLALLGLCLCSLLVSGLALDGGDQWRGRVMTVHHQQTIVTLQLGPDGNITRCETIEVNFPDQERAALATISRERPVTAVTFQQMMTTLRTCQDLDTVRTRRQPGSPGPPVQRGQWSAFTLMRGLMPGTKWCGIGDTATGWNDLGSNANLDRCCRTHDLCPLKVKAYKRRYGLFNWSPYTKSHCACDQEFYRCLKSADVMEADHVGRLFFDVLQAQCVQGHSCAPRVPADTCLEREKAEGRPTALRFSDQAQRYDAPGRRGEVDGRGRGVDRTDRGEDRTDRGEDRTDRGGDRTDRGEDRTDRGEDRTDRGEDRTDRGEDRTDRGEDRTDRGVDRTDRGVDMTDRGVDRGTEELGVTPTAMESGGVAVETGGVTAGSGGVTVRSAAVESGGVRTLAPSRERSGLSSFFRRVWRSLG